jgi:hypothetical protein
MAARALGGLVLAVAGLAACADAPRIVACEPDAGLTPVCGFSNPEDLAVLPGEEWLLVSQMSLEEGRSGSLAAFQPGSGEVRTLYPAAGTGDAAAAGFGDPGCSDAPRAEDFAPHGIDLATVPGGLALLVVNHGREAIEWFEVATKGGPPALAWRGCVPLDADAIFNDVAALPDGGFVATRMLPRSALGQLGALVGMLVGRASGYLVEWGPGRGLSRVAGTDAVFPNGVEVSPDGSALFVAAWGSREIVRVSRTDPSARAAVPVPHHPDNLSWLSDGRLLSAGQDASLPDVMRCNAPVRGTCAIASSVLAVDPGSLATELLVERTGEATGAASIAAVAKGELLIGTFAGDRLARAPLPSR